MIDIFKLSYTRDLPYVVSNNAGEYDMPALPLDGLRVSYGVPTALSVRVA